MQDTSPSSPAEAVQAAPLRRARSLGVAQGFGCIIDSGLDHLMDNRAAALAGNPEGVHQMRIAIRRLRTALVMFEPCLAPGAADRFQTELQRLGRVLGEARDWHVFSEEVLRDTTGEDGFAAPCVVALHHAAA